MLTGDCQNLAAVKLPEIQEDEHHLMTHAGNNRTAGATWRCPSSRICRTGRGGQQAGRRRTLVDC